MVAPAPNAAQPVPALDADGPVVTVTGDLDLTTADGVRVRLLAAIDHGGRVVVELRQVHHLSSAGVQLLVEVADRAAHLSIVATALIGVARVLRITGVEGRQNSRDLSHSQ